VQLPLSLGVLSGRNKLGVNRRLQIANKLRVLFQRDVFREIWFDGRLQQGQLTGRVADLEINDERFFGLAADRLSLGLVAERAVEREVLFLFLHVAFERADDLRSLADEHLVALGSLFWLKSCYSYCPLRPGRPAGPWSSGLSA
jgi:hypothetical protein